MTDKRVSELDARATPADADLIEIVADPGGSPTTLQNFKLTWANIKSTLKAYFDTLYPFRLAAVAGTDAATTMAANTRYIVDMTAWATADRNYTLPTDATVGDRIRVDILVGNASFELIWKTGAGQTCAIAGTVVAAATEITRGFITDESMVFYYAATNKWTVEYDGRIAMKGLLRLSTSAAAEAVNTFTYPTDKSGVWTADVDVGSVTAVATDKIICRRACKALWLAGGRVTSNLTDQNYFNIAVELNATTIIDGPVIFASGATNPSIRTSFIWSMAVDDYMRFKFRTQEGAKGLVSNATVPVTFMHMEELL